jgi:hydrogenase maturation protease
MHFLFVSLPETDGAPNMKRGLVVGIGNPDRGDDGIGPFVARRLIGRMPPGVTVMERSGDALALIEDWEGHDVVVLVDAAAPATSPGRIHRIDVARDRLPTELSLASTHAFGVADAVGLARTLGLLPANVIVYAVEGASFIPGTPMSPEVSVAADAVAARIAAELHHLECHHA